MSEPYSRRVRALGEAEYRRSERGAGVPVHRLPASAPSREVPSWFSQGPLYVSKALTASAGPVWFSRSNWPPRPTTDACHDQPRDAVARRTRLVSVPVRIVRSTCLDRWFRLPRSPLSSSRGPAFRKRARCTVAVARRRSVGTVRRRRRGEREREREARGGIGIRPHGRAAPVPHVGRSERKGNERTERKLSG